MIREQIESARQLTSDELPAAGAWAWCERELAWHWLEAAEKAIPAEPPVRCSRLGCLGGCGDPLHAAKRASV